MKPMMRHQSLSIAEEQLSYEPYSPTILVAGENTLLRHTVAHVLRSDGYSVDQGGIDHALSPYVDSAALPSDPVDVLVIDASGQCEQGLALLEAIRIFDWALRVIVLLETTDAVAELEAARLGANAVFVQPFDVDDLRTVVLNVAPTV